jgi:hypothetical protein
MTLPTDRDARKAMPIYRGVLKYFPDALAEVAAVSLIGNAQHHADKPIHWDKSKSSDEGDALIRHLLEAGTRDTDGARHSAKVAWRALALLQREIDAERATAAPMIDEDTDRAPRERAYLTSPTPPSSALGSLIPSRGPNT